MTYTIELRKPEDYNYGENAFFFIEHLKIIKDNKTYYTVGQKDGQQRGRFAYDPIKKNIEYYFVRGVGTTHGWNLQVRGGWEFMIDVLVELNIMYKTGLVDWTHIKPVLNKYGINTRYLKEINSD